jgi:hypothetical protein
VKAWRQICSVYRARRIPGPASRPGFSLLELNMAILLVGMGMLVLFGLFPSALREGENALLDTHTALFAEFVMSGLRAEAAELDHAAWQDPGQFVLHAPGVCEATIRHTGDTVHTGEGPTPSIEFPSGSGTFMSYVLHVGNPTGAGGRNRDLHLWARSGKFAATDPNTFKTGAQWYYTKLFYPGE